MPRNPPETTALNLAPGNDDASERRFPKTNPDSGRRRLIAADLELRIARLAYPEPVIAQSGEEAPACAGATRFDLVLMDIRLKGAPEMATMPRKSPAFSRAKFICW
jgi:hypothetical protein